MSRKKNTHKTRTCGTRKAAISSAAARGPGGRSRGPRGALGPRIAPGATLTGGTAHFSRTGLVALRRWHFYCCDVFAKVWRCVVTIARTSGRTRRPSATGFSNNFSLLLFARLPARGRNVWHVGHCRVVGFGWFPCCE